MKGYGRYVWPNGDCYEGEWRDLNEYKDNAMDGHGTYIWSDGRKYVGEWKDGLCHGHGTLYAPDGSIIYTGEWENHQPKHQTDIYTQNSTSNNEDQNYKDNDLEVSPHSLETNIVAMAIIGRIVYWTGLIIIVGRYVINKLIVGDVIMAILGLIFFPLTYFISPWFTGLWWLFLLSLVGYWVSTAKGLPPVD